MKTNNRKPQDYISKSRRKIDMQNGLYEELISNQLNEKLDGIKDDLKYSQKIDKLEFASVLSDYVATILKRKLLLMQEQKVSRKDQIAFVNKLIENISLNNDKPESDKVFDEGQQLRALLADDQLAKVTGLKAKDLPRPVTSISETSLFTGATREPNMGSELNKEIASCDKIDMIVSFIRWSGVVQIIDELRHFTENGKRLRIITTSYMGATELGAIEALAKLPNTEIKISYDVDRTRLHAKAYIFYRDTGFSTAYVGSSNLTAPAMKSGCEWNVKVTKKDLPEVFSKIEASFDGYWNSQEYTLYTNDKKSVLKEALEKHQKKSTNTASAGNYFFDIVPYPYQQAILDKLEAERKVRCFSKNLICAATGTGKTIISAFDYKKQCELNRRRLRLLFVAHRKEILEQSIECFRGVLKDSEFADVFYGNQEPSQINYLFASIDMLNSRKFVEMPANQYEYIVLDECHHIAAKSYKAIFDHFTPMIFVGLTATPERMDGESILPYFDGHIAAEIRLPEAIDRKLLCPFQYFGVSDNADLSSLKWTQVGYDKSELENVYVFDKEVAYRRVRLIINSINKYICDISSAKGLAFCVSIAHAKFMAEKLNEANIPAAYLTGKSTGAERIDVKRKLQKGDLKFICVVDLYNEGIDIKQINTILFLRPTESLTVFLQQLGRGLRLSDGKDCLTVLDFIGQANKHYSFFDTKYSSLIEKKSLKSLGIKKEIEAGFPHVPKGCYVKLEKKAKEIILENIRNSLNGKQGLIQKIKSYEITNGNSFGYIDFLNRYEMTPQMIYKHKITCTGVLKNINDAETEQKMWKKMFRLSSIDSQEFLSYMLSSFNNCQKLTCMKLSTREMYWWKIMYATFIDIKPIDERDILARLENYWMINRIYKDEVMDIMRFNFNKLDLIERDSNLPYENVLKVYSTYTRAQALAALDCWDTSSEGIRRVKTKKTTCLFVTLNKGNSYYSPSTAYHDYSINDYMFHWQSQNSTSPETEVGQRLINHRQFGEVILLFVREEKDNSLGSVPFMFLGKANLISHEGEKPMNMIWRLENRIPARFIEVTDKLGVG